MNFLGSQQSCVLYVLQEQQHQLDKKTFEHAQQFGLQHQLPLAVIYCLETWDLSMLDKLKTTEQRLYENNIPLIVLVGSRQTTLPGIMHHTKPLQVFEARLGNSENINLQKHPHYWPGVVIQITELIELQAAGKITC